MRGASTEYRESYCWLMGSNTNRSTKYEEIITQKIDGTYHQPEIPKRFVLNLSECEPEIQKNTDLGKNALDMKEEKSEPQKSFGRRSLISNRKKASSSQNAKKKIRNHPKFHNYGQGNVKPVNPNFFMNTYNIKADQGIHPDTLMRASLRSEISSNYAKPRPSARVHVYTPGFYSYPAQIPEAEKMDAQGPYWFYWPSKETLPQEYSELNKIIKNKK